MLSHSPQIVTNGLVLYYDMGNTKKSWKGKPTTNMVPNASIVVVTGGLTLTYVDTNNSGWTRYAISGTWSGGSYPYAFAISGATFTGGVSYSTSCEIYVTRPSKFANFTSINYVNDPGMTSGGTFTAVGNYWKRENFIYSAGYNGGSSSQLGYIVSNPVSDGTVFDPSVDFIMVRNIIIEQSTTASPYTSGTRSNTQSVVDLTGQNTLTTNGLTYNANGTFSFNGTTDKITTGYNLVTGGNAYSIDVWFKLAATGGTEYIFGNYGSANSAGLEYYVWQNKLNNYIAGNVQSNTTLSAGVWYHACVTKSGTTTTHYLNGNQDGSGTNGNNISGTNPFTIGNGHDYTSEAFQGDIASLKFYNRALTANEVKQNFNAHRGRFGI